MRYQDHFTDSDQTENQSEHPILRIIEQYKNNSSITASNNQNMDRRFLFQEIIRSAINQEILNHDSSKACQDSDLPTKIIKANSDIFTEVIHKELNRGLEVGNFPCTMKLANVTPVYKKGTRSGKGNYQPFIIQHALISLLEMWRYNIDQGRMFGALLTDLSKAFVCIPHDIIIANLNAHGYNIKALNFIYDYLRNRKQRTKIDNAYSSWQNILY